MTATTTTSARDDLLPVDENRLRALHERLERDAAADGSLDIAYRTIDSPVGALLLATTRRGLVRVAFEREGFDAVLESLAARISPRVLEAPARLDEAARQLEAYLTGGRHTVDIPLDHALSSGFRAAVRAYLPRIPYGHTETYKDVAEHVGNPAAVRAVGTACATNPLPLVVPCHRVVRSDSGLGGYLGGLEAKETLLALEVARR